jgi:hypothetical protein
MMSDSLTLRDRGSTSHLRLLGGPLRVATVADRGIVRDVGGVVCWQQAI